MFANLAPFRVLAVSALVVAAAWLAASGLDARQAAALDRLCAHHERFALAVHGGAVWGHATHTKKETFVERQLNIGRTRLAAGERAVDVVTDVIAEMEDSGLFNAGRGSVANQAGEIEMDASIMEGRHLRAGAVAGVRRLRNPVRAARRVMDDTPQVMFVGPSADSYLAELGEDLADPSYFLNSGRDFSGFRLPSDLVIEAPDHSVPPGRAAFLGAWAGVLSGRLAHVLVVTKVDTGGADVVVALAANEAMGLAGAGTTPARASFLNDYLVVETPAFRIAYTVSGRDRAQARLTSATGSRASGTLQRRPDLVSRGGTVGAVALDRCGDLAAGTSTGGYGSKPPGRVGDSPLIGAGTYADNRGAAVSATGHGEYFIRHAVAHEIVARIRHGGETLVQAAYRVIFRQLQPGGGYGGVIAVDTTGDVRTIYNTDGMVRGWTSNVFPPRVGTYQSD